MLFFLLVLNDSFVINITCEFYYEMRINKNENKTKIKI